MDALYKGMKPELLNNLYALLYQKAAYEITKDVTAMNSAEASNGTLLRI